MTEHRERVHQHDPAARPDTDFESGELRHLVVGNDGRMLDNRRTPIRVRGLRPEIGSWICEVMAFEDQGASWTLPVESVSHFQFPFEAAQASPVVVAELNTQAERLSAPLVIEPQPLRAEATLAELDARSVVAADWLAACGPALRGPVSPGCFTDSFDAFMDERGLLSMDDTLAGAWVSNPSSGETVKGHLIVMAEMGLAPFRGTVVRDAQTFAGDWLRERRADHVLWRLAFIRAVLASAGQEELELFRGIPAGAGVEPRAGRVLESWSFSREVAESVAGEARTDSAPVIQTIRVPCRRVFMTCLETRGMNRQFLEAEVVLFAKDSVLGR